MKVKILVYTDTKLENEIPILYYIIVPIVDYVCDDIFYIILNGKKYLYAIDQSPVHISKLPEVYEQMTFKENINFFNSN